jgi:hypothetical protein
MSRLTGLFVAALAFAGCSKSDSKPAPQAEAEHAELAALTVDEVATRLAANDGKTFIYDDNPKSSWINGHVPGAKWLPSDHVTAGDLPSDHSAILIFYCHNES